MVNRSSLAGTDDACGVSSSGLSEALPWFALRVRANHERAVQSALQSATIPEFLPVYRDPVRWSDRVKIVERPLFPGYIFSQFDPAFGLAVLEFSGVVHVLPSNLEPRAVDPDQLETIRRLVDSSFPLRPASPIAGQAVRLRYGPLAGLTGVVVRVRESLRLVVRIEMFQRAVSVDLDPNAVRAWR